jgi:hypothetical protein
MDSGTVLLGQNITNHSTPRVRLNTVGDIGPATDSNEAYHEEVSRFKYPRRFRGRVGQAALFSFVDKPDILPFKAHV